MSLKIVVWYNFDVILRSLLQCLQHVTFNNMKNMKKYVT